MKHLSWTISSLWKTWQRGNQAAETEKKQVVKVGGDACPLELHG